MSYLFFFGLIIALALLPQILVKRSAQKGMQIRSSRALTGAEVARQILQENGIRDVVVESTPGSLSDHYDPRVKKVRLSEAVYGERSPTAMAIAAHEVGHAIQDNRGYLPLRFRSGLAPLAIGASQVWILILFAGMLLQALGLVYIALGIYLFAILFQVITLPVEFNASSRAKSELKKLHLVSASEEGVVRGVLRAAALTYVAAALASILTFLYYLAMTRR